MSAFNRLGNAVIDIVFPPRCAGCGRVDTVWCTNCRRYSDAIPILGAVLTVDPLVGCAATAPHEGKFQSAIQSLKYEGMVTLAEPLGERLAKAYITLGWAVDRIVPVPMHKKRQRERGYNQAERLSQALSNYIAIPIDTTALIRQTATVSQVGLSGEERRTNLSGAFAVINADMIYGQHILLIDDVLTTGTTLATCAQTLLDVGAASVYGLTVTAAM